MKTSRYRSYSLWMSIGAFIPMLAQGFGIDILPANYAVMINALLSILVISGIISSPDNGVGYKDQK